MSILFENQSQSASGVHAVPLSALRAITEATADKPGETPVVVTRADGGVLRLAAAWLGEDGTVEIRVQT